MPQKLAGRVALITGGSSAIGIATARRFVTEGAFVFIAGSHRPELDVAISQIGHNVKAVHGDVSNLADLDRLYSAVRKERGKLDIVFANASAVATGPDIRVASEDVDEEFAVNLRGLLFTVQKALPLLQDGGSIVLNASIVSIPGVLALSVYSATKTVVRSFARTWAASLQERRIRVNAISRTAVPGRSDDIAEAVSFLASDDSRSLNGVELSVDGGVT